MAPSIRTRSSMTIYCDNSLLSHAIRYCIAVKGIDVEREMIDIESPNKAFEAVNPYGNLPTLVDRNLVLNQFNVIIDYLDERLPHPPLYPVYPVAKAQTRLAVYRIEQDWYRGLQLIDRCKTEAEKEKQKHLLITELLKIAKIFEQLPYFLGQEFSITDCCMAPFLWRLPHYKIDLTQYKEAQPILQYTDRIFKTASFQASLTEDEEEYIS